MLDPVAAMPPLEHLSEKPFEQVFTSQPRSPTIDIWERNKELIRKRTDIGEHFTREVIQSIVFIFLPLGERVHLTNLVYYY